MTDDLVSEALTELDFITEHWQDLIESRQPGTGRPWRQSLLDPDRRAAMAERDRAERANRDPDAPGFTSAPEHIDVLDVIVDIWTTLDELTAAISPDWRRTAAGGAQTRTAAQQHGPTPVTDIDAMVEFIRFWLPNIETDTTKYERIVRRLTRSTTEITRVLSLVRAGQILAGAVCPWCRGVTPKHPAGGATTLRVEEIPGKPANDYRAAVEPAAAVLCWNPMCDPPDEDCGVRFRGRPAWPWHEWDWLAKRLIIADPPASWPASTTFWDDESIYSIVHSGRSGIDQALAIVAARTGARAETTEQPGEPVRFIGGPFNGQLRRFISIQSVLAVDRPEQSRRQRLTAVEGAIKSLGEYRFEIVNEQPSYVWTSRPQHVAIA